MEDIGIKKCSLIIGEGSSRTLNIKCYKIIDDWCLLGDGVVAIYLKTGQGFLIKKSWQFIDWRLNDISLKISGEI